MGNVYASADWHGCKSVGFKILDYLHDDDKLFFLGDAIDRGPDGVDLLRRLIADDRVIYLMGNHEKMMVDSLPLLMDEEQMDLYYESGRSAAIFGGADPSLWTECNGGQVTWEDWVFNYSTDTINEYMKIVKNLPLELFYENRRGDHIILTHAGYTPGYFEYRHGHDPLWNRAHFHDSWQKTGDHNEDITNTYIVHGHTPVQYLRFRYGYKDQPPITAEDIKEKNCFMYDVNEAYLEKGFKPEIVRYCDGHKFDLDLCTIVSNRAALLNLDTFETVYFEGEHNEKEICN